MAGNVVIGALRVVLGADTASLETGLNTAAVKLGVFAGVSIAAGEAIGRAIGGAVRDLATKIPDTINSFDKLGKQAQSIGVPVEKLSGLSLAADLSGVSMEVLGKGVAKLGRAMTEAAAKPTGEAANAFKAVGVAVVDSNGKLRGSDEVLSDVAGKFENLKDGAGKTAVSMAIFGEAGANLIPLLNSGKAGLAGMIVEARELGLTIDTKTAKSAEAFNNNLTRLARVKDGIIIQLTARMLPALEFLSQRMIDAAKGAGLVNSVSGVLIKIFEGVARGVMLVSDNFAVLIRIAAVFIGVQIASAAITMALAFSKLAYAIYTTGIAMTVFNAIRSLSMKGILLIAGLVALAAGAFDGFTEKVKGIGEAIKNMLPEDAGQALGGLLKGLGLDISALTKDLNNFKTGSDSTKKGLGDINLAAFGGKNALDQFIASQKKSIEGQQAELQTIGLAAGAKEALKVKLQGLQVATEGLVAANNPLRAKLMEVSAAAGDVALKIQGAQLVQANLEPGLLFRTEMENNRLAMVAVGATSEQLARQSERDAEKFGVSWSAIGTNIAGTAGALSNLTGTFAKENKAMGVASKAFGIAQAVINTQIGITKAIATFGMPFAIPSIALAVAQGAASIASITAQKFAMGGAFRVPGGVGGGDKVLTQMALEPGELVEVSSNRAGGYQGAGQGGTFVMQGVSDDHWYSGKQLRKFAEAWNAQAGELRLQVA